jgi:hypothetical protein
MVIFGRRVSDALNFHDDLREFGTSLRDSKLRVATFLPALKGRAKIISTLRVAFIFCLTFRARPLLVYSLNDH